MEQRDIYIEKIYLELRPKFVFQIGKSKKNEEF